MFRRLLADPTVAFNGHSSALPFVIRIESLIVADRGEQGPVKPHFPLPH